LYFENSNGIKIMNDLVINFSPANILVVDDTLANLQLLVGILTEHGYKVRPAKDGFQALSATQSASIDLILLDINMPQMDGYEVCTKLKSDPKTRDIPVIFISALNDVLDKVKAFAVGGVDYVTKPFQVEEVLARVETHLALQRLQNNLQSKNQELAQTNQELANTLERLQATQNELVQSEKMAALGQLISGIAHEINTPLGAIRSSVSNISKYLQEIFEDLPRIVDILSPQEIQLIFKMALYSINNKRIVSIKDTRKLKRALTRELEELGVSDADTIADTLSDMKIHEDIDPFLPILTHSDSQKLLEFAYNLSGLQRGSNTIETASERAAKIVFALKTYAHYDEKNELFAASLTSGIDTVLTLYQNSIKQGVEVVQNYADIPEIYCYPDELNQVWTNLIHNAIQAMDNKGTLTIDVGQEGGFAKVSITDSGQGIPEEIKSRIFEPFFTTKPPGEGSGLGLDIVRKIVKKHQGEIAVNSVPGKTTFRISLSMNLQPDIAVDS
jgi:two-component system, NtrC family, sensor kinase